MMDIDTDSEVRIVVDKKGLCLNKLINDGLVRVAVAEQGYGVAKQGFGLHRLIDDPDPTVRAIVAGQGYDLDHLINDPDENVRAAAEKQLSKKISMQHS